MLHFFVVVVIVAIFLRCFVRRALFLPRTGFLIVEEVTVIIYTVVILYTPALHLALLVVSYR